MVQQTVRRLSLPVRATLLLPPPELRTSRRRMLEMRTTTPARRPTLHHTVNKANTATTITNAATLNSTPTVVGQSYAVNWSVTVSAPGSLGAALTGNVIGQRWNSKPCRGCQRRYVQPYFHHSRSQEHHGDLCGDTNYNTSDVGQRTTHRSIAAATTTLITSDAPDPSAPGQSVNR